MEEQKNQDIIGNVMVKLEKIADDIVAKVYDDKYEKQLENLDFMKKLVASNFIKKLNDFGKGWFLQLITISAYIGILFVGLQLIALILGFLMTIPTLFVSVGFGIHFLVTLFILTVFVVIGFVLNVGIIKRKKWVLFSHMALLAITLINTILVNSFFVGITNKVYYSMNILDMFIGILITLVLGAIGCALIIKNKNLFVN